MDQASDERETTAATTAAPGAATGAATGAVGATRSQNVVYTLAHDWNVIPQFLAPALERLDRSAPGTQLLIVTPDAETALAVADAALALRDEPGARPLVLPVTRAERAARILRTSTAPAVAGPADALAAVVGSAALKLDAVKTLIFAWADAIVAAPSAASLDAVLTEVPKDAARVLVTTETNDAVEALIERHLRRPRRVAPSTPATAPAPVTIAYVPVAPTARAAALRRLFDELDPPSVAVVVASDASEADARRALRTLGYHASAGEPAEDDAAAAFGPDVRVTRGEIPPDVALVVLYDVPADRAALDRVVAGRPAQIVALAQPRQLEALRAIAGGPVTPLALPDHSRRARARDEALRAELRQTLEMGMPHRELVALEPLLDEYDGVQLAAAALRLLEQTRAASALIAAAPSARGGAPNADASGMTRLFVSVGSKDGVRPGDLVGAITGEAGISSERLGKIEIRDAFSLVEVASADAARVIERVNGISIRGRKAAVREERERGGDARGGRGGDRGERRPPAGDRRGAPERRGGGGAPRGAGGPRGPGGPRGFNTRGEGPRGFGAPDDRAVSERAEQRDEWAARAERLRHSRRDPSPRDEPGSPMDTDET